MFFLSSDPAQQAWLELPNGQTFWLRERNTIGRQQGNDLVLDDHTLSRQHALITVGPSGYTVADMQSRNGTYVAGHLATRPVLLRDGDEVRLGQLGLRFRCRRRMQLPDADAAGDQTTQMLEPVRTRDTWLLLLDVEGYTAAVSEVGSEIALRRLRDWISGARPHIEKNGGYINRYVGDAILAYWLCDSTKPARVLDALRGLAAWRPHSPLPFRLVVHHGPALFSKSEHGEELGGREVMFLFRMEKIAKGFGSPAMLSPAAASSLGIEEKCEVYGRSAVDGMTGFFNFCGLPRDFAEG